MPDHLMRILDKTLAWLLLLMGVVHAGAAFLNFPGLTLSAIWFFSFAIATWLTAALNLLRIAHGHTVPALRYVALLGAVLLLLLDIAIATRVPLRGNPQVIVMFVLLAGEAVFSLLPAYAAKVAPAA